MAARAVDAARAVGLDIAGIDVLARDIARPLEEQRGAVVEVNAGPGLRMHLEPSAGKPRPVGEVIVNMLFTEGQTGRIPMVAVSGDNSRTTTRLLAHLLARPGQVVGLACADGLYVAGRQIDSRDGAGADGARAVLLNPRVSVAVLETARESVLREGLGFDRADVVVLTGRDHGDVERVLMQAVAPTGTAVLDAADPVATGLANDCPGSLLVFSRDPTVAGLVAQRQRGGRWASVGEGAVILGEGRREVCRAPVQGRGAAFQTEHVLAAAAAAWALGVPPGEVCGGLESFTGEPQRIPV
jgi:cyanophycin synthetase